MSRARDDRRGFLKLAAGVAAGGAAMPPAIARALSLPALRGSGSLEDVAHVVILMQENRSFDHYFGTLAGVRGYGDPRPIALPSGDPVWRQPGKPGDPPVTPFHLDTRSSRAETLFSLDHSWKGSHARWKHHDAWIAAKGPLSMGYFTRADIPFYYALADAFTICDAYHSSVFGPTNPNRLFLFSGTSGLAAGDDSTIVTANPKEETNESADPAKDSPAFKGLTWPTYAERLQAAGVSWKVYQEHDNYGDNGLAYFANFRGIGPDSVLYQRGRAWAPGSSAATDKTSEGEYLVAQFAADVAADRLPQVSWIVASYKLSEHPAASPSDGEHLTARLIAALTANPEVWAKTVFILNYDENDGFFDHVPPPLPAVGAAQGRISLRDGGAGEDFHGEPVGLGPRVPMIVVSPWTKGGFVNSQLFDHTSVIRFLEARFGVEEPHITRWRRTVCGDLTSVFDFDAPKRRKLHPLPDASALPEQARRAMALPYPKPLSEAHPRQEPGQRLARPLPYNFKVSSELRPQGLGLTLVNEGAAGAAFNLYGRGGAEPRFYTLGVAARLEDTVPTQNGAYALDLVGPNGFLRSFQGEVAGPRPEAEAWFRPAHGELLLKLRNDGDTPVTLTVTPSAYLKAAPRTRSLAPGAQVLDPWDLRKSHNWYDFEIRCAEAPAFMRRIAGHGENDRVSLSDPAFGRQA